MLLFVHTCILCPFARMHRWTPSKFARYNKRAKRMCRTHEKQWRPWIHTLSPVLWTQAPDDDFVTLLWLDARIDVLEPVQNVEVTDKNGTRQIRDGRIELTETGETFRRIVLETPDGEEIEYLTILTSSAYNPIDVISIYTHRTVIEILFRELKQYLNIENFNSKSLNGVLFEMFAALIGLVLIYW